MRSAAYFGGLFVAAACTIASVVLLLSEKETRLVAAFTAFAAAVGFGLLAIADSLRRPT